MMLLPRGLRKSNFSILHRRKINETIKVVRIATSQSAYGEFHAFEKTVLFHRYTGVLATCRVELALPIL